MHKHDAFTPDMPCELFDIGTDALTHVVLSLSHVQWARLACVCRVFRAVVGQARGACTHADQSTLQLDRHSLCLGRPLGLGALSWSLGLRSLVLRGLPGIDDVQLHCLSPLHHLHSLDVASTWVTSHGLRALHSMQSLRALDITFCPLVGYSAVLDLRHHCPDLSLIRRQPQWLDGHFDTPWGEVHTYYPCGAFSFSRGAESEGWNGGVSVVMLEG